MIVHVSKKEFPIYFIVEAAVNSDDIKTNILRENTVVTANGDKVKTVTAEAVLQSFEVLNWNNRIYPESVVMEGLDKNPKIQNDIKMKQFAGEYGHPDSTEVSRQAQIMPDKTSHFIDRYWKEGNLLKGEVTTAPFGYGTWMYNTIMAGRPWAFSLRAFGGVDSNNRAMRPLTIITYDYVNRPSHKEAYGTKEDIIAKNEYTDTVLRESSSMVLLEDQKLEQEIRSMVLSKSDNLKVAKELFNLQESSSGKFDKEKQNVILEGEFIGNKITLIVPVETYIREAYSKMIKDIH